MRTIQRGPTPQCLAMQPADQDWGGFMGTPCHASVHDSLRQEQHELCCYCEIEIRVNDAHIEHMEPRSQNQSRNYDYTNLALSCNGGTVEHCGHYKDNRKHNTGHTWDCTRFVLPDDPITVSLFFYLPDGYITPTEEDPDTADYLIGYLGLNCARLTHRRREHARALIDTVGDQSEPDLVAWLRQEYLHADGDGRLEQFYSLSKQILEP